MLRFNITNLTSEQLNNVIVVIRDQWSHVYISTSETSTANTSGTNFAIRYTVLSDKHIYFIAKTVSSFPQANGAHLHLLAFLTDEAHFFRTCRNHKILYY